MLFRTVRGCRGQVRRLDRSSVLHFDPTGHAIRTLAVRPKVVASLLRFFSTESSDPSAQKTNTAQGNPKGHQDLRAARRKEQEELLNATPGSFKWLALKFNPIYRKLYVVDSRPTGSLWFILIPSLILAALWLYAEQQKDEKLLDFLETNFRCSLENLEAKRYHTLLTSVLGGGGDGLVPYMLGTALPLFAFAGNLARNIGFRAAALAFFGGHLLWTASSLLVNYYQFAGINKLREDLEKGEDLYNQSNETPGSLSADIKTEKRKLVYALSREAGDVNFAALERQQYAMLKLPDNEFLDLASARYYQRGAAAAGGGLALAAVAARLHPLGMLALPFAPIPFLAVVGIQTGLLFATLRQYAIPEVAACMGGSFLLPFVGTHVVRRSGGVDLPFKEMPEHLMKKLGLSEWTLKARNPELSMSTDVSPAESLSRIFQAGVNLTKSQVDAMRKRNEKFQKRKAPSSKSTEDQS